MKKAFTLAEILIVLVVIGVLSAVLLPSAKNIMPSEDVMKFKKFHNSFYSIVREIINSDEYFLDGSFMYRKDGAIWASSAVSLEERNYMCNVFGEFLPVKSTFCASTFASTYIIGISSGHTVDKLKTTLDSVCSKNFFTTSALNIYELNDGSIFYFLNPNFGSYLDENGFPASYTYFCYDIDGIPSNATANDCVNECPFGYAVRVDGKIINGDKVDEWLQKSIQEKD